MLLSNLTNWGRATVPKYNSADNEKVFNSAEKHQISELLSTFFVMALYTSALLNAPIKSLVNKHSSLKCFIIKIANLKLEKYNERKKTKKMTCVFKNLQLLNFEEKKRWP